ncbi:Bug family tripartite tricarboxylate transporter substrate binding protein [Ramlibacter sp. MAHUQ-53]|uniref:Bug family tripartite tricarboxylate transporter substrate binding protein n=1 Tax=unclassified Ramlibacter TaxID=2617605 RepID=UPI0036381E88
METRRQALLAALALVAAPAMAQTPPAYPTKSIRLVVPFGPGGPTDIAARAVAQKLGEALGQPVVVDNKPGAGGSVGSAEVARAPADGYTLLYGSSSTLAVNPSLYGARLPYDPARAFTPVSLVARGPQVMIIHAGIPATNLREFIEYARKNPNGVSFSSAGVGSIGHLTGELLVDTLGIKATHVPYRGGAPAIGAVAAGETAFTVDAVGTTAAAVKSGRARTLAVLSDKRSGFAAEVPTVEEAGGKPVMADFWSGVVAPAGTPEPVVRRLNAEIVKLLKLPEVATQMRTLGAEAQGTTPAEFTRFVEEETRKWARVVKMTGATAE